MSAPAAARIWIVLVFVGLPGAALDKAALAENPSPSSGLRRDEHLRRNLIEMRDADQKARGAYIAWMNAGNDATVESKPGQELDRLDARHTARMKEIVAQHGWPGKSLVGEDGASAAWLLMQHATHDVPFMERCLVLMERAAEKGEAARRDLAYLTDRVRVQQGKPQLYGTQFKPATGAKAFAAENIVPYPIEDEAHVDKRRRAMGLPSMAEYIETLPKAYETFAPQIRQ